MANADKPSGLSPVRYLNGAPWNQAGNLYCIPSTDTNAYAIGDPMDFAGSADANGVPTVILATAGTANPILGALVSGAGSTVANAPFGVPQESPIVIPAVKTRAYYVLIADDPNIIYEVQEQNTGTPLAATEVGLNANLVAGTNDGYVSGWQLDNAGEAVTATLQVGLLGLSPKPDPSSNAYGLKAKWLVLINNHRFRIGQVGV